MGQYDDYIKSVRALPDYHLEVVMGTGVVVDLDFHTRLNTARFAALGDKSVFQSAYTDGDYILFLRKGLKCVKITAKEFLELVLVDKTGEYPDAYRAYNW